MRLTALDSAAVLHSTRRWRWELAKMTEGSLILLGYECNERAFFFLSLFFFQLIKTQDSVFFILGNFDG